VASRSLRSRKADGDALETHECPIGGWDGARVTGAMAVRATHAAQEPDRRIQR